MASAARAIRPATSIPTTTVITNSPSAARARRQGETVITRTLRGAPPAWEPADRGAGPGRLAVRAGLAVATGGAGRAVSGWGGDGTEPGGGDGGVRSACGAGATAVAAPVAPAVDATAATAVEDERPPASRAPATTGRGLWVVAAVRDRSRLARARRTRRPARAAAAAATGRSRWGRVTSVAGCSSPPTDISSTAAIEPPNTTRQITKVSTIDEIVLPDGPPPETGPAPRRRRWWLWLIPAGLLIAAVVGSAFLQVPYYTISPGSAFEVTELVEVDGAVRHEPEGELYLVTVSLRRATVLEVVRGWLDSAVEVLAEEQVLPPDVSPDELRQVNLNLMDDSKQVALFVAFSTLGYDVELEGEGAVVVGVLEGMPADGVLERGDIIVAVDGREVRLADDVVQAVSGRRAGEVVRLTVGSSDDPEGPTREVELALAPRPEDPDRALLGVQLDTRGLRFRFPFGVRIDSQRIGGPSAGLAFTLAVIDVLSPGELTGGRRVAATGTIGRDGSVDAVGGVAQKTVAVRRAGIDVFLVPSGDYEIARRVAGDELTVVRVDSLEEALAALEELGGQPLGSELDVAA